MGKSYAAADRVLRSAALWTGGGGEVEVACDEGAREQREM